MKKLPKMPWLHQKRFYIPLLTLAMLSIIGLFALPSLAGLQSAAQHYTIHHPAVAKIVPKALKPPDLGVPTTGNWLVIPAAELKMPIVEGPSIDVLVKNIGVWHQTGDVNHNYVIAGHRLQYFRSVNQSLYHLDVLKPYDRGVYVVLNGKVHEYQVNTSTIVDPAAVQILNQTATPRLTMYTCNDFYNHSRLVVTATPISI